MAKLVGTAELIITPEKSVLLVDGEEFPYHIAADDIEIVTLPNGASFFRVSVYAESVQVRADLGPRGSFTVDAGAETITPISDVIVVDKNTPTPNEHILAFQDPNVGSNDILDYLVRVPGDEISQDKWSWSSSPDTKGLPAISWSRFRENNINTQLKVVKVK
jgi:hypothetical protein